MGPPVCAGRMSCVSMRNGKLSPGPTFKPASDTRPLPPTATSCALMSSVSAWMRLLLELRNVSDMCRSSTTAAPRAVARDSPVVQPICVTGESLGKLTLNESRESGRSCADSAAAATTDAATRRIGNLLAIDLNHRHDARVRVGITSAHGPFRARRHLHILRPVIHQLHVLAADSIRRRLHCQVVG